MTLTGDDFIVAEAIEESQADIWYNQVVVYVDDPARAPDSVVRTNNDPSSPISVVNTGRTFTKSIQADRAADNATLITIAENFLREQASQLQHLKITASIDPRRDAHEVLSLEVDGVIASSNWWVRNFSIELKTGGRMTYDLSRTAAVVAT